MDEVDTQSRMQAVVVKGRKQRWIIVNGTELFEFIVLLLLLLIPLVLLLLFCLSVCLIGDTIIIRGTTADASHWAIESNSKVVSDRNSI